MPLPVPQFGSLDERVSSALRLLSGAVSDDFAVVGDVMSVCGRAAQRICARGDRDRCAGLRFAAGGLHTNVRSLPKTAYLQYTLGSTRAPAGVVVTHSNVIANLNQIFSDYLDHRGKVPPQDTTMVSWLPFYHDMGLIQGVFAPLLPARGPGGPQTSGC